MGAAVVAVGAPAFAIKGHPKGEVVEFEPSLLALASAAGA
jgi:hypothetical protein